ncbi:MAG: LacI family DNA-binding transcriptional regulator, partial [Pseudomonadota bacterium]
MSSLHDPIAPGDRARRTTISDVSEALGLTKSTVSRALNDYPDISEGTRTRVRRMAQKMGYRPLATAQAIRTGRVQAIGFIIELSEREMPARNSAMKGRFASCSD